MKLDSIERRSDRHPQREQIARGVNAPGDLLAQRREPVGQLLLAEDRASGALKLVRTIAMMSRLCFARAKLVL